MSELSGIRLTLISDPTVEFPNNTNTDFKVRLAEPLQFARQQEWETALVSMSTPNRHFGMESFGLAADDPVARVAFFYGTSGSSTLMEIPTSSVFREPLPTTGSEFWQRVVNAVNNGLETVMQQTRRRFSGTSVPIQVYQALGGFKLKMQLNPLSEGWVEGELEGMHLKSGEGGRTSFGLNAKLCKAFGFASPDNRGRYLPGSNAAYQSDLQQDSQSRSFQVAKASEFDDYVITHQVDNDQSDTNTNLVSLFATDDMVYFSHYYNWTFGALDSSFEKITAVKSRSLLVYSNLVESSLIGGQKAPLLREVFLKHEKRDARQ